MEEVLCTIVLHKEQQGVEEPAVLENEIRYAIKKLKINKAVGINGICGSWNLLSLTEVHGPFQ